MLAKFRCSDHDLLIETGRYKNVELQKRLGKMCNNNCIEDEIHLITKCSKYETSRQNQHKSLNISKSNILRKEGTLSAIR